MTISAARAVYSATPGKRMLVAGAELAHSLADSLDNPLTPEPGEIAPNLWAQEVNVQDETRHSWSKVQEAVSKKS